MVTRPGGCTCTYLDNIHADNCPLIDSPPTASPPRNTYIPPGTRGHYPGKEATADAVNRELRRRIGTSPLPPPAAPDPAHLDDDTAPPAAAAPRVNLDGTNHDDALKTAEDAFVDITNQCWRRGQRAASSRGNPTPSATTPTPEPMKATTAYTDGLRRGFAEALDVIRALPTGPQLEAAVLIRQRAHEWEINP